MDQRIVEKFLNETCTVEEGKQVVEWFATEEGQEYLCKRLDEDAALLQDKRIKPMLAELDSEKLWKGIETGMKPQKRYYASGHYRRKAAPYWYAAAIILVAGLFSVFFYWQQGPIGQTAAKRQPLHFAAGADQQKSFILRDGSKIKLNSHSQLWISANYGRQIREITLKGEAYFEVEHNQEKPFVIHAHGVTIKDLGTEFDVRAIPGENSVQIAVKTGKVAIQNHRETEGRAVQLTGGQFGYINLQTDSISINKFAVENYLSWMNGRFKFDHAPLGKVSEQLSRIYNVSFAYAADSLKNMTFSASFSRESLKRTLAVISLTLSIDYQMKNHYVIWSKKE